MLYSDDSHRNLYKLARPNAHVMTHTIVNI